MKNIIAIFLISLLSFLSVKAQRTDLIYGAEKFTEKQGKYKLEILKNGNTANVGINESVGFFCTLYDANKKIIAQTIVPVKFDINACALKSVFEINNDIFVMIVTANQNAPVLSRYIFDGTTGKLKKEELIISGTAMTSSVMTTDQLADMIPPEFFVQKDPNSDYYAVAYFDYFSKDINKKILVVHYSPTHGIISKAYLQNPAREFLNLHYVDMYVNGGISIILSSYLYNIKDKKEACFYLSELKRGAVNFRNVRAVETDYYFNGQAMFVFNKVTNKLLLLSLIMGECEKGWIKSSVICQTVNMETLVLTDSIKIYSEKLDNNYMSLNSSNMHYPGLLQNYCITPKGNTIILSEDIFYDAGVAIPQRMAISCLTPAGEDMYGEMIHYIHRLASSPAALFYAKNSGKYTYGNNIDEFGKTYVGLIAGKTNCYLFLNNTPERFTMTETTQPSLWTPVSSSKEKFTSFIYTLNDAGIVSKEYIFGVPATEAKYCRFNTADYDPETGLYAVIVVEKIKGKKTASVLWLNLK